MSWSLARACCQASQAKNGTKNNSATMGTLSGVETISQSWCQSMTEPHILGGLYGGTGLSISEASITGAGPEIPPSFRTRQKCTPMKTEAMMGMAMQCQMYARNKALHRHPHHRFGLHGRALLAS